MVVRVARPSLSPSQLPRRPQRWLGVALSVVPGLGHLYAGAPARALAWLLVDLGCSLLLFIAFVFGTLGIWAVAIAAYATFRILVAIDAFLRIRDEEDLRWRPDRGALILGCLFFSVAHFMTEWASGVAGERWIGGTLRIQSADMEPTMLAGDWLVASAATAANVERDHVYAFRVLSGSTFVHRVTGIAGDTLSMRSGALSRNGSIVAATFLPLGVETPRVGAVATRSRPCADSTARLNMDTVDVHSTPTWGPIVVPCGQLFVSVDNRSPALRMGQFGPVPNTSIFQQPRRIYFSVSPDGTIRWSRIGRAIDD